LVAVIAAGAAGPPFFLQDRFCTAKGANAHRLRYVTSLLRLDSQAAGWKLN
jgi:hypothetical protein